MFEQFDKNEDNESIKKTAGAEFERLKQFMWKIEGKAYKGQFFNWTDPRGGNAVLLLGEVAAQFIDLGKRDVAKKGTYIVRFGQRPYSAQEQSPGELVHPDNWELTPSVVEGQFVWLAEERRYFPEMLAEAIALKLAEVSDAFTEATGF